MKTYEDPFAYPNLGRSSCPDHRVSCARIDLELEATYLLNLWQLTCYRRVEIKWLTFDLIMYTEIENVRLSVGLKIRFFVHYIFRNMLFAL